MILSINMIGIFVLHLAQHELALTQNRAHEALEIECDGKPMNFRPLSIESIFELLILQTDKFLDVKFQFRRQ